jgi:CRP-like cAMP-binding protein
MRELLTQLTPHATRQTHKKHTILLYQGEAPRQAYVVVRGAIKVYSINTAGEEQIVTFETPGDLFPAPWIFKKATHTLYYCETMTDCEVLAMPRDRLLGLLNDEPALAHDLLEYFVSRYTGLLVRATALEQSRARQKIMFTMYYLLFRYGRETTPGVFVVGIKLTHGVLASLVGLTRETTTNELTKLKAEGVLGYGGHQYTIDKNKLERLLGEDSFDNLQLIR